MPEPDNPLRLTEATIRKLGKVEAVLYQIPQIPPKDLKPILEILAESRALLRRSCKAMPAQTECALTPRYVDPEAAQNVLNSFIHNPARVTADLDSRALWTAKEPHDHS